MSFLFKPFEEPLELSLETSLSTGSVWGGPHLVLQQLLTLYLPLVSQQLMACDHFLKHAVTHLGSYHLKKKIVQVLLISVFNPRPCVNPPEFAEDLDLDGHPGWLLLAEGVGWGMCLGWNNFARSHLNEEICFFPLTL